MQFGAPLDAILRTATHVRVLRALLEVPRGFGVSGREIARRAGVTHPSANKVLATLREQGLVSVRRSPRFDEYALSYENALSSAISVLFAQEQRLVEELKWTLRADLEKVDVKRAYLFGSVVRGTSTASSDIDLAVDPPTYVDRSRFASALEELREKIKAMYGNDLNFVTRQTPGTAKTDALWRRLIRDATPIFDEKP